MTIWRKYLRMLARPAIVSSADLTRYVVIVTAFAVAVAVSVDIVNQSVFFVSWSVSLRSWALSAAVAAAIAVPISRLIGQSQRDLYRAKQVLETMSRTDVLTGLPNRRALLELSDDGQPRTMVLVIVDIDRFKTVNDTHGHLVGDAVIRAVGQMMRTALGEFGTVGRLGGEEFALLSSDDLDSVLPAVMAFRHYVELSPILTERVAVTVTISAGIASRPPSGSFEKLYSDADEALYAAKRAGRNRVEIFGRPNDAHLAAPRDADAA